MRSERDYPWGQNQKAENIEGAKVPEVITQGGYQVILIAGPNGVGKGTVINGLLERNKELVQVSRTTTKPVADSESQYHQVLEESFFEWVDKNDFFEWGKYGQGYYGTSIQDVVEALGDGKKLIVDIDLDGGLVLREFFQNLGVQVYDCFISPVSQSDLEKEDGVEKALAELQDRLTIRSRGEVSKEIEGRLRNARQMLLRAGEFKHTIFNGRGNIDQALLAIEGLLV